MAGASPYTSWVRKDFNVSENKFMTFEGMLNRFHSAAQNEPSRVVLDDRDGMHDFGDVLACADRLFGNLRALGVGEGDLVGLLMDRDIHLPAAILALFGLKAAYLPLEKTDPPARQAAAVAACECRFVIGTRAALTEFDEGAAALDHPPVTLAIEDLDQGLAERLANPEVDQDTLAYVLLTSGSTGTPKAVSVTHGNVIALLDGATDVLSFTPDDRYLATSPLTFDASIPELFLPLTTGARIVLRDRDLVLAPKLFTDVLTQTGATIAQTTPSTWSMILAELGTLPRLRLLITHGEAITPAFARDLASRAGRVLNMYGPTETTVWATAHDLTPAMAAPLSSGSAPIGTALPHIQVLIRDATNQEITDDAPGELCLGGPSVTAGYRNDAARSDAVFFEHSNTRFYKTGDLVCKDADNVIHYLGRIDDQLAINGLRIEPGEIETALSAHDHVKSAAVTWYEVNADQRAIVAGVVAHAGHSINAEGLRQFLSDKLNRSQLPAKYLILDALPTLNSGKLDRKSLRALADAPDVATDQTQDLTPSQAQVAQIWADLLDRDQISAEDQFFVIGGDSLSAVAMISRVNKAFDCDLDVTAIFETPLLREFAQLTENTNLQVLKDAEGGHQIGHVLPMNMQLSGTPLFFSLADYAYPAGEGARIPCPFYNLTVWNRTEGIGSYQDIETFAAQYREELVERQANGPYRLAGYSVGGILIFEVARQLIADGEKVATLFLLDPTPPTKFDFGNRTKGAAQLLSEARRIAKRTPMDLKNLSFWNDYRLVNAALKNDGATKVDAKTRYNAMRFAIGRMAARYVGKPLDVDATIVSCDQGMIDVWSKLIGGTKTTHLITAKHMDMFHAPTDKVWTDLLLDQLAKDGA